MGKMLLDGIQCPALDEEHEMSRFRKHAKDQAIMAKRNTTMAPRGMHQKPAEPPATTNGDATSEQPMDDASTAALGVLGVSPEDAMKPADDASTPAEKGDGAVQSPGAAATAKPSNEAPASNPLMEDAPPEVTEAISLAILALRMSAPRIETSESTARHAKALRQLRDLLTPPSSN